MGTTTGPLVDADWVHRRLDEFQQDDPSLRLLEVDMEPERYDEGHIPGAESLDWTTDLAGDHGQDLVDADSFARLCRERGITDETTVVLYGDRANWFAAHAYWLFTYYGHDDLALIDGGREYWMDADRPVTEKRPSFTPRNYEVREPDESIRAYAEDVEAAIETDETIIDVRNPQEYRGEKPPADIPDTTDREGHIPGAENLAWGEAVNFDGTFKSREKLREIYGDDDERTIAYCRIGERSSHTWFVLHELLGTEAANYDGSWTEWSERENAAIETGSEAEPPSGAAREGGD